jgi:hypothetical protein
VAERFASDEVELSSSCSSDSCNEKKDKIQDEPVLDKIINEFMKELQDKTDDPEVNRFLARTT